MKKAFLLIAVPFLLVTLGFGQTPAPNANPEQASIKGCLGGSDGNYTIAEDGTTQTFRITSSTVDLKPHVGHDVEVIGQTANAAASSGPSDNTMIASGVNMISDHCATATASAPAAADPASPAAASTPAPAMADPAPATVASTPAPAAADPAPATVATAPAASDPTPIAAADAPARTPVAATSAPMMDSTPAPETTERLPDTASSLPMLGLLGFGLLTTGLLTRRLWTNQR
jgi:hypothetical protein